jgi:hypothetical protein
MNRIGIIGMGPRGLSVLERIAENARAEIDDPVVVHVIEPRRFGSGDVWRTDQSNLLIMNIVASQITASTDDSVRITGPIRHGPNLYEWAVLLADGIIGGDYPVEVREEAARTHANSYCSRSFYGHFLEHAYARVLRELPHNVQVREHNVRAVGVVDTEQERDQVVVLADGQEIEVDEVVLALGHGRLGLSAEERFYRDFAARAGGQYFPPVNPADVDLSGVEPGQPVLMRGLGLCFFDYVALLTAGRGGRFVRSGEDLEYLPSGDEPAIFCGSRRGVPLHARAVNEKGDRRYEPIFLTEEAIAALRSKKGRNGVLDFWHDCWPLVGKEVETVYYTRLVAAVESEDAAMEFCSLYRAAPWGGATEQRVLRAFGVAENERWSWTRIARPWAAGDTDSVDSWQRFLRSYLLADVREARRGNIGSPLKAGVDVLRDIRNEIRCVMNNGGVDGASYGRDVEGWFNSLHAFLSIGPPLRRIEELVALMDAGVVRVAGPGFTVDTDLRRRRFVGRSSIPDDNAQSSVVIDAMLPKVDLTNSCNSVLTNLANSGQLTTFVIGSDSGQPYRTGGVAVTERPFHPIRTDGSHHPRRYVFGIPTEGANWVTETGIRPNVNSITLGDSDAIARSALGLDRFTAHLARDTGAGSTPVLASH